MDGRKAADAVVNFVSRRVIMPKKKKKKNTNFGFVFIFSDEFIGSVSSYFYNTRISSTNGFLSLKIENTSRSGELYRVYWIFGSSMSTTRVRYGYDYQRFFGVGAKCNEVSGLPQRPINEMYVSKLTFSYIEPRSRFIQPLPPNTTHHESIENIIYLRALSSKYTPPDPVENL